MLVALAAVCGASAAGKVVRVQGSSVKVDGVVVADGLDGLIAMGEDGEFDGDAVESIQFSK